MVKNLSFTCLNYNSIIAQNNSQPDKLGTSSWSPSKVQIMAGAEPLNEEGPHIAKLEKEVELEMEDKMVKKRNLKDISSYSIYFVC